MRFLFLVLMSMVVSSFAFADLVDLRIVPDKPKEFLPFQLNFIVSLGEHEDIPFITFQSSQIKLSERIVSEEGYRSVYKGGKIVRERTVVVSYHMKPLEEGEYYIKDIEVSGDGWSAKKMELLPIRVYSDRALTPQVFIKTEYSKEKELFLHEGFTLKHYLYYRDVKLVGEYTPKKYPAYKDFIARKKFHTRAILETAKHEGKNYNRFLLYEAKLFPQKTGKIYLDQFSVEVGYSSLLSLNGVTQRSTYYSQVVSYTVKPMPEIYTKEFPFLLVGKHQAKFTSIPDRVKVDDMVSLTLSIEGSGELESFEPPTSYQTPLLEEFDAKSEFVEQSINLVQKKINYTFLAKKAGRVGGNSISIPEFDPVTLKINKLHVIVPPFEIMGGAEAALPENMPKKSEIKKSIDLSFLENSRPSTLTRSLMIVLVAIFSLIILLIRVKNHLTTAETKELKSLVSNVYSKRHEYSDLYRLLDYLIKSKKSELKESLSFRLEKSTLPEQSKLYFLKLLKDVEEASFSKEHKNFFWKMERKHLKIAVKWNREQL